MPSNKKLRLFFLKAKNCGACKQLDKVGVTDKIKAWTVKENISFDQFTLASLSSPGPKRDRWEKFWNRRLRSWFPLLALIHNRDIDTYNEGEVSDEWMMDRVVVLNGIFRKPEGKLVQNIVYRSLSPNDLDAWKNGYLESYNQLFKEEEVATPQIIIDPEEGRRVRRPKSSHKSRGERSHNRDNDLCSPRYIIKPRH